MAQQDNPNKLLDVHLPPTNTTPEITHDIQLLEERLDDLNDRLCRHEGKLELLTNLLTAYLTRYPPHEPSATSNQRSADRGKDKAES